MNAPSVLLQRTDMYQQPLASVEGFKVWMLYWKPNLCVDYSLVNPQMNDPEAMPRLHRKEDCAMNLNICFVIHPCKSNVIIGVNL